MVGISNFRTDGSKSGQGSTTTSNPRNWNYGRGYGMMP